MGTYFCQQADPNQIRTSKIIQTIYNKSVIIKNQISATQNQNNQYAKKFFPCKYLGQGIYGTIIQVLYKEKAQKYALKIIKTDILLQDYLFLQKQKFQVMNKQNMFMNANEVKVQNKKMYILYDRYYLGDLYYYAKKFPQKIKQSFIIQLTIRLVNILEFIHDRFQIIYRNLRPENILFTNTDGDFQLSQLMFSINSEVGFSYFGAATYAPPQVYLMSQQGYDKSIDYWMLGVLLYQILVGYTPFQGQTAAQIKQNILSYHSDSLKFPQQLTKQEQITDFITKLLQPKPQDRLKPHQIKRHRLFHGQIWNSDVEKKPFLNIKSNAQKQDIPLPNRIIHRQFEKGARPITQNHQLQILQQY